MSPSSPSTSPSISDNSRFSCAHLYPDKSNEALTPVSREGDKIVESIKELIEDHGKEFGIKRLEGFVTLRQPLSIQSNLKVDPSKLQVDVNEEEMMKDRPLAAKKAGQRAAVELDIMKLKKSQRENTFDLMNYSEYIGKAKKTKYVQEYYISPYKKMKKRYIPPPRDFEYIPEEASTFSSILNFPIFPKENGENQKDYFEEENMDSISSIFPGSKNGDEYSCISKGVDHSRMHLPLKSMESLTKTSGDSKSILLSPLWNSEKSSSEESRSINYSSTNKLPFSTSDLWILADPRFIRWPKDTKDIFLPKNILFEDKRCSLPKKKLILSDWAVRDVDLEVIKVTNGKVVKELLLNNLGGHILSKNGFSNLMYFSSLTNLTLENCEELDDDILVKLSKKVYKLTYVNIAHSTRKVTNHGISSLLKTCKSLNTLNLSHISGVNDSTLASIRNACNKYQSLVCLLLKHCIYFSNEALLLLLSKGGSNLLHLDLSYCTQINELGLMGINRSDGKDPVLLQSLKLNFTSIRDTAINFIANGCLNVEELDFSLCRSITDSGLDYITYGGTERRRPNLKKLRKLSFKGCAEISDENLAKVFDTECFHCLSHINLEGCLKVGHESLTSIGKHMQRLVYLNLKGLSKYNDESIHNLLKYSCLSANEKRYRPSLIETLDLSVDISFLDTSRNSRCARYTDAAITTIAKACSKSLKVLKLNGNVALTDKGFSKLKNCEILNTLEISGCLQITDAGLVTVIESCSKLKHLAFSNLAAGVTDSTLYAISKYLSKDILHLETKFNYKISDNGIMALGKSCFNLEYLDIEGCDNVTDIGLQAWAIPVLDIVSESTENSSNLMNNRIKKNGLLHQKYNYRRKLRYLNIKGLDLVTSEPQNMDYSIGGQKRST